MLNGRLVHVGETVTDLHILAVNCTKMRLAAGPLAVDFYIYGKNRDF